MLKRSVILVTLAIALVSCGTNSTTGPTTPGTPQTSCRTYNTDASSVTTSPSPFANSSEHFTCMFSSSSHTLTCTHDIANQGCSTHLTSAMLYASVADFVDEIAFIGLNYQIQVQSTGVTSCPTGSATVQTTINNVFDSQRRLTVTNASTTFSGPGTSTSSGTITTTAWDSHGRPTAQTSCSPGLGCGPITYSYNDGTHTMTQVINGVGGSVTAVTTINGNVTTIISTSPVSPTPVTSTITLTPNTTAQVCK